MSGEYIFPITGFSPVSQAITRSNQMMACSEKPRMKEFRGSKELWDLPTLDTVE